MKTKLLFIAFILSSLSSRAQISIQERAASKKNFASSNHKLLDKSILTKIKEGQSDADKTKIDEVNNKTISLNEKFTELGYINSSIKDKLKITEEDIKNDPFYYDYFKNKKESLDAALVVLKSKIGTLNNDLEKLNELETQIKDKTDTIKKNDEIITALEKIISDSYKMNKWLPSRSSTRNDFYDHLFSKDNNKTSYLLNDASALIGNNTAAISSELVTSYIKMIRVSFGTLMTNSSSSSGTSSGTAKMAATADPSTPATTNTDSTDAFQRLLSSGGGNLYLKFDFPIYYAQSKLGTFFINSSSRFGTTVKQFSNDINTAAGSGNSSINMYGSISSDDDKSFIFFFNGSFGGYAGGGDYYSQLNLAKNGIFAFSHLTVGVDISSSIRITYMFRSFGSDENLRSTRGVVGVQLLKGLFDKK